jgi:REP element-mobilizing transposase RayT
LGEIKDNQIRLSDYGAVVQACWLDLPNHYPRVALDALVLMPNHVHGILILRDVVGAGLQTRPYEMALLPTKRCALFEIIRGFKTYSARRVNELREAAGVPLWQRSYYEHIIRDEDERRSVQEYIVNNPVKWSDDMDNPVHFLPQT